MSSTEKQAELERLYRDYAQEAETGVLQEVKHSSLRGYIDGYGPLDAPLVVVGEAPGEDEEREGRPFVGKSGQLLQELFKQAEVPWELCYVMNVIPWRPVKNRTPYPYEVMASWRRVEREIEIIGPFVVLAVGGTAWFGVTRNQYGRFDQHRNIWQNRDKTGLPYDLLGINHPGWILRQSGQVRDLSERITVSALKRIFPEHGSDEPGY